MIDIKFLRDNPEILKENLRKRNFNLDVDKILSLDAELRSNQQKSQTLSAERNRIAKEIGILKSSNKDISELLIEVSANKDLENNLVKQTKKLEEEFKNMLSSVPNLLSEEVPFGENEDGNIEIKKFGEIRKFNFVPKEHGILGEELGMMDFKIATYLSGSRFVVLKKDLSKLERALFQFMIDMNIKRGFVEHSLPVLVQEKILFNTGQLPKFREDLFKTDDNRWLIPTTEVTLTNIVANQNIEASELPYRFTALSLCFRSEAGAAGKDTKGMLRQHQFYKVELVSISNPDYSFQELEYMRETAENILQELEIPYRVMLLCSGDIGFSSAKTYDLEVWIPSQNTYREISSCSNCTDFQARRMNTKMKGKDDKLFVHTLNGSSLAVGRTLLAILENYQQEDGSVVIPKALRPYMNNQEMISK